MREPSLALSLKWYNNTSMSTARQMRGCYGANPSRSQRLVSLLPPADHANEIHHLPSDAASADVRLFAAGEATEKGKQ